MKLSNDRYVITLRTKSAVECYYRDEHGWVKESCRGRKFRATGEQVLNHLLPLIAGMKPGMTCEVQHRDVIPA